MRELRNCHENEVKPMMKEGSVRRGRDTIDEQLNKEGAFWTCGGRYECAAMLLSKVAASTALGTADPLSARCLSDDACKREMIEWRR